MASPYLLQMPDSNTGNWQKVRYCDDTILLADFHTDAANRGKCFEHPDDAHIVESELPFLIYLPGIVAVFAMEKERTTHEVLEFITTLSNEETAGIGAGDIDLMKHWLMAAGQKQKSEANNRWSHPMGIADKPHAVMCGEPSFLRWADNLMRSYLGQGPNTMASPTTAQVGDATAAALQSVAGIFTDYTRDQKRYLKEQTKAKSEGSMLDEYDMAALKGFAGVSNAGQVPGIYALFKTTNNSAAHRTMILEAMEKWAEWKKVELDEPIFLSKPTVKSIVEVSPNPTETWGTSKTSDLGVTNMACLPRRQWEIEQMIMAEQAEAETEATRTQKDVEKRLKGEVREPPSNYFSLKLNVATTAGMVFVCYGAYCPLYINLMKLYDVLNSKTVKMYKGKFTPLLCRQITFAIYDDMRTFFAERLRPGQFVAGARTAFPMSLLSEITSSVRYQNPVLRPNFPRLWEGPQPVAAGPQAPSPAPATGGGSRGGGTGGGTGGRGHDPSVGRGYDPVPPRFEGQGYEMRKQKWLPLPFDRSITHVHPIISAIMGEYWELVDRHSFSQILKAAGKTYDDLPSYPPAMNPETGRDGMCWNNATGPCIFGDKCKFKICHFNGGRFPDEFCHELVAVIKTGVDKIVRDEKKRKNGGSHYGPSDSASKRRRH